MSTRPTEVQKSSMLPRNDERFVCACELFGVWIKTGFYTVTLVILSIVSWHRLVQNMLHWEREQRDLDLFLHVEWQEPGVIWRLCRVQHQLMLMSPQSWSNEDKLIIATHMAFCGNSLNAHSSGLIWAGIFQHSLMLFCCQLSDLRWRRFTPALGCTIRDSWFKAVCGLMQTHSYKPKKMFLWIH